MATPIQIIAALTIENTYHILYPTAPKNYSQFGDITDWAGLGYTTGNGDVVKGIFKVIDPVGQVIYENSGYASDVFSSQDWDLTDLVAPQFNLLTYTGTDTPVYGDYIFLWKVQVTPNGLSAFVVEKEFIVGLSNQLSPTLSLEDAYDCDYATFTSTDTTTYGAPAGYTIQSITKTHVTRPPLVSKKSDGVTAQPTVTSSSTTNLLAAPDNPLWTGAYSSSIAAIITYKSGNNYTIVNCPAVEKDTTVVCDTSLCKLFCYLKKLYTKYFDFLAVGNTVEANMALSKWQKGSDIFVMIWKATTCSTGDVESLTNKFYDVTGFTAGCDCGCDGDMPAPVIPTNVVNGTDGTDGLTAEFRVTGTLFQWRYTTGGGWTTLFDFSTITGTNGTNGANGANGTSLIHSDPAQHLTTGTSPQTLSTFSTDHTNDAKNLVNVGDTIRIYSCYRTTNTPNDVNIFVTTIMNGVGISNETLNITNTVTAEDLLIELFTDIILSDNTSGAMAIKYKSNVVVTNIGALVTRQIFTGISTLGGATVDFAVNDYSFAARAQSVATGDISLQIYQAELLAVNTGTQSPSTNIKYITPFTTTAAVQSYANIIGNTSSTVVRVYLDGELLPSSAWTYTAATDTLLFNITITGASEVAADYV